MFPLARHLPQAVGLDLGGKLGPVGADYTVGQTNSAGVHTLRHLLVPVGMLGRLLLQHVHEVLAELQNLGSDNRHAVGLIGIVGEVLLMIILGPVEILER